MTCHDAVDAIARAEAGLLAPDEWSVVERHLAGCERCQVERALQIRLTAALRVESERAPAGDFTARVLERIRVDRVAEPKTSWWMPIIPAMALGLSILAIRLVVPVLPLPAIADGLRALLRWMENGLATLDLGSSSFGLVGSLPPYTLPAVVFTAGLTAIMVWGTREIYTPWRE